MRPPIDTIVAPSFPKDADWINVATLKLEQQAPRPVLIDFWDFCRPSSIRALAYLKEWQRRYEPAGLRIVSVHAPGFPPSRDADLVAEATRRLGIEHAVLLDPEFSYWQDFDNPGWPARYLFGPDLMLVDVQIGEGGYVETEQEIQRLLGLSEPLTGLLSAADDIDAEVIVPTPDQPGAYSGPYAAGQVWIVSGGSGSLSVNGEHREIEGAGAHLLLDHGTHSEGVLELKPDDGLEIHATCFIPGLAT
ncbi:MAG: DipZ protein [Actinobacteria bacterium]|uniref:Unannotated protein n=1 Tax=freshwater metagenome TaxID=449393 RepID=A0A6J5ZCP4_9ZZZZ|nr:DipZ protein [Actinomycetota bacterium]